jgi:hypothetical protein
MKKPGPTGWRGVMNQGPRPSDFGLSPLADNVDSITQRQRVRVSRISHGIGGGMRVHDDSEMLRITAPRFSPEWMGRRLSLTGSRAAFGMYSAILVALLLIGHVHLRFQIHDMNMQQHALQSLERNLQRQSNTLHQHMSQLIDLTRLENDAVSNLNMVENGRAPEVEIDPALQEKYSPQAIAQARKEKQEESTSDKAIASRPFRKIADMAWAFADSAR